MKIALPALTLLAALLLPGCFKPTPAATPSSAPAPAIHYWATFTGNGDKPGTGFILAEQGGGVLSGKFYILDPNKAGNFNAGFAMDLKDLKNTPSGITFTVNLPNDTKESMELDFDRQKIPSGKFSAILKETSEPDTVPSTVEFTPTPNPPPPGRRAARRGKADPASSPLPAQTPRQFFGLGGVDAAFSEPRLTFDVRRRKQPKNFRERKKSGVKPPHSKKLQIPTIEKFAVLSLVESPADFPIPLPSPARRN